MSIEALSGEATRLALSVEFWRVVRLIVVAGTVFLATATMIAQWMELRRSHTLASKQKEVIALKDAQLRTELAEKDARIAEANRAAADANERAGNAIERAARVEMQAAELQHRNLEMQKELDATTRTAAASHQQLIARLLRNDQISAIATGLSKSMLKARVPIIASESSEARHLASQLTEAVLTAGWDTEPQPGTAAPPWEGIVLTVEDLAQVPESAVVLANQLRTAGLEVKITDRLGGPKVSTLQSSRNLMPGQPKLEVLNLWIGEKPTLKESR
jgi:hypothetical protein